MNFILVSFMAIVLMIVMGALVTGVVLVAVFMGLGRAISPPPSNSTRIPQGSNDLHRRPENPQHQFHSPSIDHGPVSYPGSAKQVKPRTEGSGGRNLLWVAGLIMLGVVVFGSSFATITRVSTSHYTTSHSFTSHMDEGDLRQVFPRVEKSVYPTSFLKDVPRWNPSSVPVVPVVPRPLEPEDLAFPKPVVETGSQPEAGKPKAVVQTRVSDGDRDITTSSLVADALLPENVATRNQEVVSPSQTLPEVATPTKPLENGEVLAGFRRLNPLPDWAVDPSQVPEGHAHLVSHRFPSQAEAEADVYAQLAQWLVDEVHRRHPELPVVPAENIVIRSDATKAIVQQVLEETEHEFGNVQGKMYAVHLLISPQRLTLTEVIRGLHQQHEAAISSSRSVSVLWIIGGLAVFCWMFGLLIRRVEAKQKAHSA